MVAIVIHRIGRRVSISCETDFQKEIRTNFHSQIEINVKFLKMIWLKISLYIGFCWCQMAAALNIRDHQNWPHDMDNECGISYTDRIIGGTNASLGQYPWLARLAYMSKESCAYIYTINRGNFTTL